MAPIEIIAVTLEDAKRIEAAKADRIELVSALSEGGLTPSFGLIEAVIQAVKIPVNVIIRPHSRGFVYTDEEIKIMKQDIKTAKQLGANGVVLGVLTSENKVDINHLEQLLMECQGLEVTFHRAVDETHVVKSIQTLSQYPQITNVLTSGGIKNHIDENLEVLKDSVAQRAHLDILVGGGLTLSNVATIQKETLAQCFHFGMAVRTGQEIDPIKIKQVIDILS